MKTLFKICTGPELAELINAGHMIANSTFYNGSYYVFYSEETVSPEKIRIMGANFPTPGRPN